METTAVKLYSTGYREAKTYLAAALFVAGNIVLPQICHLVPQGGLRWLPIYFFTLVGANNSYSIHTLQPPKLFSLYPSGFYPSMYLYLSILIIKRDI